MLHAPGMTRKTRPSGSPSAARSPRTIRCSCRSTRMSNDRCDALTGEDFSALHAAMQRLVDTEILAGVSSAVLVNGRVADLHCAGWADREARVALRPDHK